MQKGGESFEDAQQLVVLSCKLDLQECEIAIDNIDNIEMDLELQQRGGFSSIQ